MLKVKAEMRMAGCSFDVNDDAEVQGARKDVSNICMLFQLLTGSAASMLTAWNVAVYLARQRTASGLRKAERASSGALLGE